ncbi:hypothetical protein BDV06DRAFT_196973 [Aspergillus oleicola]
MGLSNHRWALSLVYTGLMGRGLASVAPVMSVWGPVIRIARQQLSSALYRLAIFTLHLFKLSS